jgi:hypothetical protein
MRFTLKDGGTVEGIIADLFIREGAEWLRLDDGTEARLDDVVHFIRTTDR